MFNELLDNPRALIIAVLLHVLIIALLFFGFQWSKPREVAQPIAVEMLDAQSVSAMTPADTSETAEIAEAAETVESLQNLPSLPNQPLCKLSLCLLLRFRW